MVRGVKAGELCGTIAGLPWHRETRREVKEVEEEEEGEDQRIQRGLEGGWVRRLDGVSVPWW